MNRRTFLNRAVFSAMAASSLGPAALIDAAAGSSTRRRLSTIGLQLYTVRNEMQKDFAGTLAQVAAIGYSEVELVSYYEHSATEVRALLDKYNLKAPSIHINTATLRGELQPVIDKALVVGHKFVTLGYVPPDERKTLDDYKKLIDYLNHAGQAFNKAGLQFCYHNHDFEFANVEGKTPYDLILAQTDAQQVKMELDLYWIKKGGHEPTTYFARYPGRFPLIHVKDMDATPKQFFTEVGNGIVDFKTTFRSSKQAGIKHYFVEQDSTPGSPFDSIKTSFENLRKLEF